MIGFWIIAAKAAIILLFLYILIRYIKPLGIYLGLLRGEDSFGEAMPQKKTDITPKAVIIIFAATIALRCLMYAFSASINADANPNGLGNILRHLWLQTSDSSHYLGIAQNWYTTVGDPRFHIVFLPFFPILVKILSFITGEYLFASLALNTVCTGMACVYLFKLAGTEPGKTCGIWTMIFFLCFPAAFFLYAPMTEPLFLMLSVMCVYYAICGNFWPSVICGMFAAFTRSLGFLLVVPVFFEILRQLGNRNIGKYLLKNLPKLLLIPLGFAAYIFIIYLVTGDPFKFLEYQRDHWNQTFGSPINSIGTIMDYAFRSRTEDRLSLWIPQIICIFGVLAALAATRKKLRPSLAAYAWVYIFAAISPTWLLSAPRYLLAAFPVFIALAGIKSLPVKITIAALSAAILFILCYFFNQGYSIY